MPKQSQRAYTLTVKIGGDTWQDVVAELNRIADHVGECGEKRQLVSGGQTTRDRLARFDRILP